MPDTSLAKIEKWAAGLSVPAYAIDDQTAIKVVDGTVEVVSEGHWKLFTPQPRSKLIVSGDTRARLGQRSGMSPDATGAKPVTPWFARLRCPEPVP